MRWRGSSPFARRGPIALGGLLYVALALAAAAPPSVAAERPEMETLRRVFPGAERFGPFEGNPPAAQVFRLGRPVGWVLSSREVVGSVGYTGKPFDILVGLDMGGRITGAELVGHNEPILVIGVSDEDLARFVRQFRGVDVRGRVRAGRARGPGETGIDGISGATISSVVFTDAILRAARAVARSRGLIEAPARAGVSLDLDSFRPADWEKLVADGAVARLRILNRDVDEAFQRIGIPPAPADAARPDPEGTFLDLSVALATPAQIGRNLLGDREYTRLSAGLRPGEHAILVMASGLYSVKGTAYVRTGVFDRIQILQGERTLRLARDQHTRIERLAANGAPEFREIGWFALSHETAFDPLAPWRLQVLVGRSAPAGGTTFVTFELASTLPAALLKGAAREEGEAGPLARLFASGIEDGDGARRITPGLWIEVWRDRPVRIAVLSLMLVVLTFALFFQDALVRRPLLYERFRTGFLAFTLVWLGLYAGTQLSVVNVLTFAQALLTGFRWDLFLIEPLIFILWSYVAVAMLFWGRGVFCGWLCPFGALQELLNKAARWLRVPQVEVPFGLHERLWPIKYVLFIGLFAVSLHSMTLAVLGAEVEPFKTAISLRFVRHWPFVAYAVGLLAAGLFVERFYCRYLCALGAGLAVPARLATFRWLKRRHQCGSECHICAVRCPVQSIHPGGEINPNECVQCLKCQVLYYDDRTCPPLITRRKRREERLQRREAAAVVRAAAAGEEAT